MSLLEETVTFSNPGVLEVSGNGPPILVPCVPGGSFLQIDGMTVSTSGYYDSALVQATCKAIDGCFYFEVKILQGTSMRIGWTADTVVNANRREALGSDADSWGWDGSCQLRFHNDKDGRHNNENQYGEGWRPNDTIGCLVDFGARTISYSKNGRLLGSAWSNFQLKSGGGLHPCVSLSYNAKVTMNLGPAFVYKPKGYYGMNPTVTEEQKSQIQEVFLTYQERGATLTDSQSLDLIKMKGTLSLAADLGAKDPLDPHLLVLAWKLKSRRFFEFYDSEWNTLWALEQVFTWDDMKRYVERSLDEIKTHDEVFRAFYVFTFDYLLKEKGDKCTAVEKNDAVNAWQMLWLPKRWQLFDKWVEFWKTYYMKGVTRDTWIMLLTAIDKVGTDKSKFNEDDCWPTPIEDFYLDL